MYLFEHLISKWVEMVQCVSRKTLKLISWCNVMSRSGHECKNILSVGRLLIDIDCLLCLSFNYPPQPNLHCKTFSYIIFVYLTYHILLQLHIVKEENVKNFVINSFLYHHISLFGQMHCGGKGRALCKDLLQAFQFKCL